MQEVSCGMWTLSCGTRDLVDQDWTRVPCLKAQSPSHWTQQHRHILLQFRMSGVYNGFPWLKSRHWQGCIPSSISRENPLPCLFRFLEAVLLWLLSPAFKASNILSSSFSLTPTRQFYCCVFSDSDPSCLSLLRTPCDYSGPTWVIQHSLHLKIVDLITAAKFFSPWKVTYPQVSGWGRADFGGLLLCPLHIECSYQFVKLLSSELILSPTSSM